ncbi:hypothetical protein ATK36_6189 [Amycolatopsis sulphurea]|uniref:Uncharacterized protein n=1 Tax=Amycolatopsis sulphurea TaxID=76022 RepID=A0A2A9FK93_9PSEU|nr:hypothetical protein [Amycolatopsis sulphurea]PFG50930.1 hypothetical protein ATK36_6189 [Amycolatopsis sulphurea]
MTADEQTRHTALSRLVLCGWEGTPIGDPSDPAALIYVRERGAVSDAACVQSYNDAVATREVRGTTTRAGNGTVADVVHEVLSW